MGGYLPFHPKLWGPYMGWEAGVGALLVGFGGLGS